MAFDGADDTRLLKNAPAFLFPLVYLPSSDWSCRFPGGSIGSCGWEGGSICFNRFSSDCSLRMDEFWCGENRLIIKFYRFTVTDNRAESGGPFRFSDSWAIDRFLERNPVIIPAVNYAICSSPSSPSRRALFSPEKSRPLSRFPPEKKQMFLRYKTDPPLQRSLVSFDPSSCCIALLPPPSFDWRPLLRLLSLCGVVLGA